MHAVQVRVMNGNACCMGVATAESVHAYRMAHQAESCLHRLLAVAVRRQKSKQLLMWSVCLC